MSYRYDLGIAKQWNTFFTLLCPMTLILTCKFISWTFLILLFYNVLDVNDKP